MKAKFLKAVDNHDLVSVRLFLANELMLDPRGLSFKEMKSYAETHFRDLYENPNSVIKAKPQNEWDEEYMFALKNELDTNFSKNLLDMYEQVAKEVLHEKALHLDKEESDRRTQQRSTNITYHNTTSDSTTSSKKKLAVGLTVGGTAVTIAGLCLEKIALTSLGVVGLAIGGILLYNETKK